MGLAVSVAVVDGGGAPVALSRMDGAEPTTPELALNKAFTAVSFQVPTDQLLPEARQPVFGSLLVWSRGRIMVARGGIPIVDGITVTGAIGVAGATDDGQDHLCCRA